MKHVIKYENDTFPNEDISECISCKDINLYYLIKKEICIFSCKYNEYFFDNICYDKCPNETYLYITKHICLNNCDNDEYDTKRGENDECIDKTFELEKKNLKHKIEMIMKRLHYF